MFDKETLGQLIRAAALLVATGLLSVAAMPALQDKAIAFMIGGLVFIMLAPLVPDHSPRPHARRHWRRDGRA